MLAPMAGYSDRAMRVVCHKYGSEYSVSEMVSATALYYGDKKTLDLMRLSEDEGPCAVQIFGKEPEIMAYAADKISSGISGGKMPVAIDINMGCPVKKIVSNGEGSALMKTPALAADIARAVVNRVKLPVTVKIRAGWDAKNKNAVEMAKMLEDAGVSAICVHARTRDQFYSPGIDMEIIAAVKSAVSIAVIGNGDIYSAADAKRMFEQTGCDGIMIGRGATGNPWLFDEIVCALEGREFIAPTGEERVELALKQLDTMIAARGERAGFVEGKKHMAWYSAGLRGSAAARNDIMQANTCDEIRAIFEALLEAQ